MRSFRMQGHGVLNIAHVLQSFATEVKTQKVIKFGGLPIRFVITQQPKLLVTFLPHGL
jgi:hypothetical protein